VLMGLCCFWRRLLWALLLQIRSPIKCYVCVFICFTSKAVHLELVKDLTTASFLSALKILMSTRGRPSQIWADNATNL